MNVEPIDSTTERSEVRIGQFQLTQLVILRIFERRTGWVTVDTVQAALEKVYATQKHQVACILLMSEDSSPSLERTLDALAESRFLQKTAAGYALTEIGHGNARNPENRRTLEHFFEPSSFNIRG